MKNIIEIQARDGVKKDFIRFLTQSKKYTKMAIEAINNIDSSDDDFEIKLTQVLENHRDELNKLREEINDL